MTVARDPDLHDPPDEAPVAPVTYAPPVVAAPSSRRRPRARELLIGSALLAGALVLWFLMSVRAVELRLDPPQTEVDIAGVVELRVAGRALLRPGAYRARASAAGYHPIEQAFTVGEAADQHVLLRLSPLPGRLKLVTAPVEAGVTIDGQHIGQSNGEILSIEAGTRALRVEAERYLPIEQSLQVEGRDVQQTLELTLAPAFGVYRIDTAPVGARVLLDGVELARTPAEVEVLQGPRALRVTLDGYRDETLALDARAGERRALDTLALQRADAQLRIGSRPAGASITLDGVFLGMTPLELALESGKRHELIAFKAGHEQAQRSISTRPGTEELILELRAMTGELRFTVQPPDAEILAGERLLARGSGTVRLPATPQRIVVRRAGYVAKELSLTPRPGFAQEVTVTLTTGEQQKTAAQPAKMRSHAGQEFVLLSPGPFHMGSSRREPGRRANELIREVRPRRPFYVSVAEVTNAEFRQFRPAHSSGNFKGKSLNGNDQPAVNLGWSDAALYCNWLSERDGLKPFYRGTGKSVTGVDASGTGYRLPTEAEWAWAATLGSDGKAQRFPWGAALPPPAKAGNYADRSGESLLGAVIAGYDDGFAVAAPVRRFAANRHGLFDIDGNAAEWVHDLYEASPPVGAPVDDPLGPDIGEYHVVRGSSWRHGALTELRLAYRDYGKDGRADVGFRVARYAR